MLFGESDIYLFNKHFIEHLPGARQNGIEERNMTITLPQAVWGK